MNTYTLFGKKEISENVQKKPWLPRMKDNEQTEGWCEGEAFHCIVNIPVRIFGTRTHSLPMSSVGNWFPMFSWVSVSEDVQGTPK